MKKLIMISLVLLLTLVASINTFAQPSQFKDTQEYWAQSAIDTLASGKIIDGEAPGLFKPEHKITRAEFTTMIVRLRFGLGSEKIQKTYFKDVNPNDWYAYHIETAAMNGLIKGYEDGTFKPNALINREEMTAIIIRAASLAKDEPLINPKEKSTDILSKFTDSNKIVWAHNEMAIAIANGFIQGKTDTTIEPLSFATRAEAAWLTAKLLNKPYKLLVYYGIPQGVNETWDDNLAAQIFAKYDYIVFGDGLEHPDSPFNVSTKNIITKVHTLNPKSIIFGYVDLGVSTTDLSIAVMQTYSDQWKVIGADGIFLDDAGYDYNTPRSRLNTMLDYIQKKSMHTIVNAWDADEVMGNKVDPVYNPAGEQSHMGSNDYYLLESFVVALDDYASTQGIAPSSAFKEHLDKAVKYRKQLGVKLLSLNAAPFSKLSNEEINKLFKLSETAAVIGSLDGYSLTPVDYSGGYTDGNIVRVFNYLPNYYDYYTMDVHYQLSSDSNVFSRNGFSLDLTPGKQSYVQPLNSRSKSTTRSTK